MAKKKKRAEANDGSGDQAAALSLPPGVKLLRTLQGHQDAVYSVAFDPQGETLASGSRDKTVKLWEARSGKLLRTFQAHTRQVISVAFSPTGSILASGSTAHTVKLWEPASGKLLRTLEGHAASVISLAFSYDGDFLASGSVDDTVRIWQVRDGAVKHSLHGFSAKACPVAFSPTVSVLATGGRHQTMQLWNTMTGRRLSFLEGHAEAVSSIAFDPQGSTLASGSLDNTVKLWEARSGKLLRTLEGHTGAIAIVGFSPDGRLLASKSHDDTIRLWSCKTWETVAVIPEPVDTRIPALAFHPTLPLLATAGLSPGMSDYECSRLIHLWDLDFDVLLGKRRARRPAAPVEVSVQHRTAKVILVGDTGVGKSGLAHRLVLGKFIDTRSSHARQALVLDSSTVETAGGVDEHRETVLWDLAGQPAYRLVHQLAMDDAAVACVLLDARSETNPLEGAAYWSQALDQARTNAPIAKLLVPARMDVGGLPVSPQRLRDFAHEHGFAGVFPTSAFTGEGCDALLEAIREHVHWDDLPAVSSTATLAALRDFVGRLKGEKAAETEAP